MPTITFRRASNIQNIPVTDGQIIFDTARNIILMDNGNTRNQYAGATQLVSTTPEARNDNAFNAQASTQLFLQKTTVVDTKANALAVTQNYIPLGCLAFKDALGTYNYNNIGNGTISGALVSLNSQLNIGGNSFYFDYQDGEYGYNTDPSRGADTFHPFKSANSGEPVFVGKGTQTFDISDFKQKTIDNFIVQPIGASVGTGGPGGSYIVDSSGTSTGLTLTKTVNGNSLTIRCDMNSTLTVTGSGYTRRWTGHTDVDFSVYYVE